MAITDLQISDTLETGASPIKYEGDMRPQQVASIDPMLQEAYDQYVYDLKEHRPEATPMTIQEFRQWIMSQGQAGGADALRSPAAYGGIMDVGGRRRYGIGSRLRKLIPNEISRVAEVAAPFVAPFNPLAAGLMSGIGGWDRHGSLGKGLKSGLMTYGGGQLARVAGGAGPQWGISNTAAGPNATFMQKYLSSPYKPGQDIFSKTKEKFFPGKEEITEKVFEQQVSPGHPSGAYKADLNKAIKQGTSGIMDFINKNSTAILLGSMGIAAATAQQEDVKEAVNATRGTKLDIDAIRAEVQEALAGGKETWNKLKEKYPYIGEYETKIGAAEGGRIGLYAGGQSIPSDYTMEDARKTSMQDKMGGITEAMKVADLYRKGDVGQFYAAQGGRIGYDAGGLTGHPPITTGQIQVLPQMPGPQAQRPNPMPAPQPNRMAMNPMMGGRGMHPMMGGRGMHPMMGGRGINPMMGGRRMAQEGGLMDLGGMEKDYRNDGGFVPIGGKEKADDVPARLSKNEFVFTADAVRGAGGGDIDKGAEIMENVMKNLEQGGQISEESQGLSGAREMFDVSERLSEVV